MEAEQPLVKLTLSTTTTPSRKLCNRFEVHHKMLKSLVGGGESCSTINCKASILSLPLGSLIEHFTVLAFISNKLKKHLK